MAKVKPEDLKKLQKREVKSKREQARVSRIIKNNVIKDGVLAKGEITKVTRQTNSTLTRRTAKVIKDSGLGEGNPLTIKEMQSINSDSIIKYEKKLQKDLSTQTGRDKNLGNSRNRANLIGQIEVGGINKIRIIEETAKKNGVGYWVWGETTSANEREDHLALVGTISKVGESPARGGEFPGELPNCKCSYILTTKEGR